jgi:hypothetical protein
MSKNQITFYNATHGKHVLSLYNPKDVFDREDMIGIIDDIENKRYEYDDIIIIDIVNLKEITEITDLPKNLQKLMIKNAVLKKITIPQTCTELESIFIDKSNIEAVPKIEHCVKLKHLSIQNSRITSIPKRYPPLILSINLSNNWLSNTNTNVLDFPTTATIMLFNNNFSSERVNSTTHQICWGTQNSRGRNNGYEVITNYNIQLNENINMLENVARQRQLGQVRTYADRALMPQTQMVFTPALTNYKPPNLLNSGQTVHINSICNSVTKTLQIVCNLTNQFYSKQNQDILINEFLKELYGSKGLWEYIKNIFNPKKYILINCIEAWVGYNDVHTKTNMNYGELLARVWIIIKNHNQKVDFIENVKIEMQDSIGVCFTGRFNRLVNSLVGFVDGATVGISVKEQLQMEIGKLVENLGKEEITYEKCKKQIEDLFNDPDVKEDETITSYYKQSWLDALEDYKPDEVPQ